jgi:hypothetical protein
MRVHTSIIFTFTQKLGKVHFWPSNSYLSLVLAIVLQNRVFSTIQLLKSFIIGHRIGFDDNFNFFIYNLVFRS